MANHKQETVVGRITSVFGVKGWVKVYSYTEPMDGILDYPGWLVTIDNRPRELELAEGKRHGPGLVVRFAGVTDRETAQHYCGTDIRVPLASLPPLPEGEYYWYQLEGLRVETSEGVVLGHIRRLMETGANDVLVVQPGQDSVDQRERLIPYLPEQVVQNVNLAAGSIVVDWNPEF